MHTDKVSHLCRNLSAGENVATSNFATWGYRLGLHSVFRLKRDTIHPPVNHMREITYSIVYNRRGPPRLLHTGSHVPFAPNHITIRRGVDKHAPPLLRRSALEMIYLRCNSIYEDIDDFIRLFDRNARELESMEGSEGQETYAFRNGLRRDG